MQPFRTDDSAADDDAARSGHERELTALTGGALDQPGASRLDGAADPADIGDDDDYEAV
jgi:hypothetical protein